MVNIKIAKREAKERTAVRGRKQRVAKAALLALLLAFCCSMPAYATSGNAIIQKGFDVVYSIIAAIVSAIGSLYLLWGLFEWAQSLNTQDGGAQSMAFKRIASGLVATMGPQLIPIITRAIGN